MADFLKGIDVSRWQDPAAINWSKVKAGGYSFVFIKTTDGSAYKQSFIDACLQHATAANAAGLTLGYYHFAHPTSLGGIDPDAKAEANFFLETIGGFPNPALPLVLDLEDDKMDLSPDDTVQWINIFRDELSSAGKSMILYSSKSYLDSHLPAGHTLGEIPLWLAYYPRVFDPAQNPRIPSGWSEWTLWQYTQSGTVPGVSGAIDISLMKPVFVQPASRGLLRKVHAKLPARELRHPKGARKQRRKGSR